MSRADRAPSPAGSTPATPLAVSVALGLVALAATTLTIVGSDALWLPAMGGHIRQAKAIPSGIPFASAPSTDWVNTTVLGQLVFSLMHSVGSLGIVVAQIVAVMATLALLAAEATRRRAKPVATAAAVVAVCLGAVAPLFIARAQLLSLVPYALLLILIRRQHERPSKAIWWAIPLIAIWSNLHGAVLAGVAVLGCYLLFSLLRVSPSTAVAVGVASLVATCLNPGLLNAPRYYVGVFGGAATSDDSGMWSRVSVTNPFDLLLLIAAAALAACALRRRIPLWEYAAGLGLVLATLSAARHGIWLLLFLLVPAAVAVGRPEGTVVEPKPQPSRVPPLLVSGVCLLGVAALLAMRTPTFRAADAQAAGIAAATRGQIVLVTEPLAESLAAAGATVWASNPLDAFARTDQDAYLAFMRGDATGAAQALAHSDVVVTFGDSPQFRIAIKAGFTSWRELGSIVLLERPAL